MYQIIPHPWSGKAEIPSSFLWQIHGTPHKNFHCHIAPFVPGERMRINDVRDVNSAGQYTEQTALRHQDEKHNLYLKKDKKGIIRAISVRIWTWIMQETEAEQDTNCKD